MQKAMGVSRGIAIGKALVYENKPIELSSKMITLEQTQQQKEIVENAINTTVIELEKILEKIDQNSQEMMFDLIEIQIELAQDPMLKQKIDHYIDIALNCASDATIRATDEMAKMFQKMENEYYRARSADISDVGQRIVSQINGVATVDLSFLQEACIVVAQDITPSETVTMDKEKVLGFVTHLGSKTSHTAILANILSIPALVKAQIEQIRTGDMLIIDGTSGEIIFSPTQTQIEQYYSKQKQLIEKEKALETIKNERAQTTDNEHYELCINITEPVEANKIETVGADGVGLFRTEFLYMNEKSMPNEQTQFEVYKEAAIRANGKSVTIRTLDIGGDKNLEYLKIPKEENPFLGYRAIRICLDQPDIFVCQLRAILRASAFGNLRIMFPMICTRSELLRCKQLVEQCKKELDEEQIKYDKSIKLGIMVEVPSVAVAAEIFAKHVDFFSIGTNDLCQYTLAVDRMNPKIADLYNHFNPGVLRLIKHTIDAANEAGICACMCGEMAGDLRAIPLLIGLGLNEFSMSPNNVPYVKEIIRNLSTTQAQTIAKQVLELESAIDIQHYLEEKMK